LSLISQAFHSHQDGFVTINDLGVAVKTCLTTPKKILYDYNDNIIFSPVDKAILIKNNDQISGDKSIIKPGDVTTVGDLRRMSTILNLDNEFKFMLLNFNLGIK
jgi:hypothetical protein